MLTKKPWWSAGALVLGLLLSGCSATAPDTGDAAPEEDAEERVVEDSTGEVRIPAEVERVVTVHHIATQPLVNLGVVPVGRGAVNEPDVTPETWELLEEVPVVSDGSDPEVEQVASLEPDLIVSHNRIDEGVAEHLAEIAPVLTLDIAGPGRADWRGRVELVARATGNEDAYEQLVADLDERVGGIAQEHAEVFEEETFSLFGSWTSEANVVGYGSRSHYGDVFDGTGMRFPDSVEERATQEEAYEVHDSVENMPELLDGSVLLYVTNLRGEPTGHVGEIMDGPLYDSLPAVDAGRAFPGGKDTVGGFEDANYNLDLLEEALAELS